jgi:hypothetical protein
MMARKQYSGDECKYGHPEFYDVVDVPVWGGNDTERRRGPTCWRADCDAHKRWKANERHNK